MTTSLPDENIWINAECSTEIDQNFSQAHRIVTTSILPLVEQYAENSRDVWEGAKVSL